jgi:hypothetical protein
MTRHTPGENKINPEKSFLLATHLREMSKTDEFQEGTADWRINKRYS